MPANERNFYLSRFKLIKERCHERLNGSRDAWFERIEQMINQPAFPDDFIRIINILIEDMGIFSIQIMKFTLLHDSPDVVLEVISILNESERDLLINALNNVFKNPDPVSTARCWSILSRRDLLEGRQEKLITHANTQLLYKDALHVMDMVNFPLERYVDKFLDELGSYDLKEYTEEVINAVNTSILKTMRQSIRLFHDMSLAPALDVDLFVRCIFKTADPARMLTILTRCYDAFNRLAPHELSSFQEYFNNLMIQFLSQKLSFEQAEVISLLYQEGIVDTQIINEIIEAKNRLSSQLVDAYIRLKIYGVLDKKIYRELILKRGDLGKACFRDEFAWSFRCLHHLSLLNQENIVVVLESVDMRAAAQKICIHADRDQYYALYIKDFFETIFYPPNHAKWYGQFDTILSAFLKLPRIEDCISLLQYRFEKRKMPFNLPEYLLTFIHEQSQLDAPLHKKLFQYVKQENKEGIIELMQLGMSLEETNENHATPLLVACTSNSEAFVCFLLNQGANPNYADDNEVTPFFEAIARNQFSKETIQLFIHKGANTNVIFGHRTPFTIAICRKNTDIANLLARNGAEPNCDSIQDERALLFDKKQLEPNSIEKDFFAACKKDDYLTVERLQGTISGYPYFKGIKIAVKEKNYQIVKMLMDANRFYLSDDFFERLFSIAMHHDDIKTIEVLLSSQREFKKQIIVKQLAIKCGLDISPSDNSSIWYTVFKYCEKESFASQSITALRITCFFSLLIQFQLYPSKQDLFTSPRSGEHVLSVLLSLLHSSIHLYRSETKMDIPIFVFSMMQKMDLEQQTTTFLAMLPNVISSLHGFWRSLKTLHLDKTVQFSTTEPLRSSLIKFLCTFREQCCDHLSDEYYKQLTIYIKKIGTMRRGSAQSLATLAAIVRDNAAMTLKLPCEVWMLIFTFRDGLSSEATEHLSNATLTSYRYKRQFFSIPMPIVEANISGVHQNEPDVSCY